AALLCGWVNRLAEAAEPGLRPRDLARETAMRKALAARSEKRVAAVVGSFHAAALLEPPELWEALEVAGKAADVRTTLNPYSFELLDSRSGYPAGIRDPRWQQEVFLSGLQVEKLRDQVAV